MDAFTDDEITTLTMLPSLIGSAVAFSEKSGPIGTAKEMMANARAAAAARQDYPDNSIIQTIMPQFAGASEAMEVAKARQAEHAEQLQEAEVTSVDDMRGHAFDQITAATAILDAKADPTEAAQYREWVLGIGQAVAEAAKEGGFFGIGGTEISAGEVEALAEIRLRLGL